MLAIASDLSACLPLVITVLAQEDSSASPYDVLIVRGVLIGNRLRAKAAGPHLTNSACCFVLRAVVAAGQVLPPEIAAALPSSSIDGLTLLILRPSGSGDGTDATTLAPACAKMTVSEGQVG